MFFENAKLLAYERHKGQFRWDKVTPYYEGHLVPVANRAGEIIASMTPKDYAFRDEIIDLCKSAAILHDILEDTPTTKQELIDRFSDELADIVELLTHRSDVEYCDYIENLSDNDFANIIKQCDLDHNSETASGNKLKLYKMAKKFLAERQSSNTMKDLLSTITRGGISTDERRR